MPVRVGIDLVAVASVQESLSLHAERYLERIFTPQEVADSSPAGDLDPERLAGRFAAKEATLKVLRPGRDDGVRLTDIEVRRAADGWVELALSGTAAALAARAGVTDLAVSLTHEAGMASAVVIAEIGGARR